MFVPFLLFMNMMTLYAHSSGTGTLSGRVLDADTGEPVGFTYLLIEEIHFWQRVNADGSFKFDHIPAGHFSITTHRLGYQDQTTTVDIGKNRTTEKNFRISVSPLMLQSVAVSGEWLQDSTMIEPEIVVADKKLRQNLGMTIAKTIENEPGLDQISMGPAPARPVLRGLGGDRLLLLEDGERTGDLSATSADHAVSIDPMTTTRIEVIRGPEALIYGSNTLGGVINVIREAVPRHAPQKRTGSATAQGESVNRGSSGALELSIPAGPVAVRGDFSLRSAGDVQTPAGTLRNTNIRTVNGSTGASLTGHWGFAGISGGVYDSKYGIPPDPIGGHPSGVDIDMLRQHAMIESEFNIPANRIRHVNFKYQYSRYQHQEIESSGSIGMEFGVVTHNLSATLHFCECGLLGNARVGFWSEHRDYASGGLTFTPASDELSGALFFYNEYFFGQWSLNASLRTDLKSVRPKEEYLSRNVGSIRERNFSGLSGGLSVNNHLTRNLKTGVSLLRTFRAPGVEELFSEGPHLAAYSYEIGNADLNEETGIGLEWFAELKLDHGSLRASLFRNNVQHYIFPQNTGERSWRRADLYLYQYTGLHTRMDGFECSADWMPLSWLSLSGQLQAVYGMLVDKDEPLPRMPPLSGKVEVGWHHGSLCISMDAKGADKQDRLGGFEESTDGYVIYGLNAQMLISDRWFMHTLTFTIENITDTEYRRHLNRVKAIMPEPGRNIRLLYKIFF